MREIFATVCLVGAIQALFLFIVLLIKRNNQKANIYLSFYLLFITLDLFELYRGEKGLIGFTRTYQLSIIPYSFIFGPSMFLYIAFLTARFKTFSKKYLLLYVPFVITLAINIILLFAFEPVRLPEAVKFANIIINGGGLLFEAILYVLSFLILQKYVSNLKEYFSDIDMLKLSFIRAGLFVMIIAVSLIFITYTNGHVRHEHEIFDVIAILVGLGLVFIIAFLSILQPEIFNRVRIISNAVPDSEKKSSPKYEKLRLPATKEKEYVKKLQEYMSEKKPFLNYELTLQNLADELSLSTHHLSMILNIHCKQSFYNFVNSYRVEYVKHKLINAEFKDQNILTIAYGAGFNSKSTFNTMFKKFTGKTPKEYRKHLSV